MKKIYDNWAVIIFACLTLGLAPFTPEPHIWGKIRWIRGGAIGMKAIDWFDFFIHGIPWFLLLRLIFMEAFRKGKQLFVKSE